ncbi:hypothetical protein P308_02625 [Pseudomonas piscis]|nr:hypothetical protein P308_02625 [Pseudomonas piscis]
MSHYLQRSSAIEEIIVITQRGKSIDIQIVAEGHSKRSMYVKHQTHAVQLVYVESQRVTITAKHSSIGMRGYA